MSRKITLMLESIAVFSVMLSTCVFFISLSLLFSSHSLAYNSDEDFMCKIELPKKNKTDSITEAGKHKIHTHTHGNGNGHLAKNKSVVHTIKTENPSENRKHVKATNSKIELFTYLIETTMRATIICGLVSFLQINVSAYALMGEIKTGDRSFRRWRIWIIFTIFSAVILLLCLISVVNIHRKILYGFKEVPTLKLGVPKHCYVKIKLAERYVDYLIIFYAGLVAHALVHGFKVCMVIAVAGSYNDKHSKLLE